MCGDYKNHYEEKLILEKKENLLFSRKRFLHLTSLDCIYFLFKSGTIQTIFSQRQINFQQCG